MGCCGRCQLARLRGIWWAMDLLSERAKEVGSQQFCCSNLSPASASCLIPCCAAAALVHASSGPALVWYWQIWHLAEPVPEGVHAEICRLSFHFLLTTSYNPWERMYSPFPLFADTFATNHIALVRLDPTRSRTIRCWVPSRWYGLWPFQLWGSLLQFNGSNGLSYRNPLGISNTWIRIFTLFCIGDVWNHSSYFCSVSFYCLSASGRKAMRNSKITPFEDCNLDLTNLINAMQPAASRPKKLKINVVNPVVHLVVNDVVNVSHETLAKRTKKGGRRCGISRYFSMFFNGKPFSW